jgi:hypothetical protein
MTSIWASVAATMIGKTYPIPIAPFVEPEAHHVVHGLTQCRAIKVEICTSADRRLTLYDRHRPGIFVS